MHPSSPNSKVLRLLGPVLAILAGSGCTSNSRSLPVVSASEVNTVRTNEMGTIQSVRAVIIEGGTGVKSSTGQTVGSQLGRAVATGQNPVTAVAGAAGSVVGGIAGVAVEKSAMSKEGQEITVQLDDGSIISVVQPNNPPFIGGERVRILRSGGKVTIYMADAAVGRIQ